jgi:hypothetical protein
MFNVYNPFICNWKVEIKKAKAMSVAGLIASIVDCQECIANGIDTYGKYVDQISIYRKELNTRKVVVIK